ncbi:hypothetical protein [Longispora urticae]
MEFQRMARDERHELGTRVFFAALGWANRIGHAEFAPGGLGRLLVGKDGKPLGAQSLSNALARAKDRALIAPSSNARCLVLPPHQFQKAGIGTGSCRTHGLRVAGAVKPSRVA